MKWWSRIALVVASAVVATSCQTSGVVTVDASLFLTGDTLCGQSWADYSYEDTNLPIAAGFTWIYATDTCPDNSSTFGTPQSLIVEARLYRRISASPAQFELCGITRLTLPETVTQQWVFYQPNPGACGATCYYAEGEHRIVGEGGDTVTPLDCAPV